MNRCKYFDCGWCYAPDDVSTSAQPSGACAAPTNCLYLKSQQPVQYETPMTEIEELKGQIKVLQKKLSFLEELEKTKTPCEEAYKNVYGKYPVKEVSENLTAEDNWNVISWDAFQKGYEQSQKDYKVGEFQEPVKDRDEVSLYKRFVDEGAYGQIYYVDALKVVKEFLMDEGVIEDESGKYITFTLQKSLLEVTNDY